MFGSFRLRLALVVLLLLVPVLILMLWMGETQRRQLIEDAQQDALALAQAIGNEYQQYVEGGHDLLSLLSHLPIIRTKQVDACNTLLATLVEENPVYNGLFVADAATGIGFCSSAPTSEPFDNTPFAWYQEVLDTQDFVVSEFRIGPLSGRPVVTMGYPVVDEQGEMIAVVAASLSLSWLNTFAETSVLPSNASFTILDGQGTVLIRYPEQAALVGQPFRVDAVRQAALGNAQGVIQASGLDGTPRIYAYASIAPDFDNIHVLVGIPEPVALADADYVRDRSILVLGLITLLGIAAAWFSGTIISRPIHDLTQAIRSLGSGELRTRTSLYSDIAELQELLVAFNVMATAVEQSMAARLEQVTTAHAERLTLLEAEQKARTEAEQTAARLSDLQTITAAFSEALTIEQIGTIIVGQAVTAVGALNGSFQLLVAEGTAFEMLVVAGEEVAEADRRTWQRYPADPLFPVTTVAHTKQALWFESGDEIATAYPALAELVKTYPGASALLPVSLGEKASGVISITFAEKRPFSEYDRAFLLALAHQCAQAVERIRLGEKEKELAVLQERQRLARELHDAVSQSLFSANIIAESLPRLWERNPERAFEQLSQLHQLTSGAAAEMRTLLLELRPENVVNTNLSQLLTQLCHALKARKHIAVSVQFKGDDMLSLPEHVHVALYRIAQESLTNVVKHGNAKQARVRVVRTPHQVELTIVDNGRGFDVKQISAGFGLNSMGERAASIGGTLQVKSRIGIGTRVKVVWNAGRGTEASV